MGQEAHKRPLWDLDLEERVGREHVVRSRLGTFPLFVPSCLCDHHHDVTQELVCSASSAVLQICTTDGRSSACKLILQFVQKLPLPTSWSLFNQLRGGMVLEFAF